MFIRAMLFLIVATTLASPAFAELVISMRSGPTESNEYHSYYRELIRLALEKTKPKYGDYRIEITPQWSWFHERALAAANQNAYPNLIVEASYEEALTQNGNLSYIDIPIDGGILGYRVCFVSPQKKAAVQNASTLEDLKKFKFAHGIAWADTLILRANGFNVVEVSSYESIFKMLVADRVDLVCFGANQLKAKYEEFKHIKNLSYDESFVLVYPLPRFFFTNSENTIAKARIYEGLKIAFKDGSFKKLWLQHNGENIAFANLKNRKSFQLANPLLKNLKKDYQSYFFDPMSE